MAHIEDDFAAYTTIGDRVAPPSGSSSSASAATTATRPAPAGPKFGVPAKLEPFTLLAKSARGAGAANLISQAVSAPGVYVFSELLHLDSIRQLATHDQHSKQYKLLELFAYGTWNDYTARRDEYPTLTREQELKLKQLTILSLASETRILPYATLLESLEIRSIPELEDVLIESIYSNILRARLDQKSARLEILSSLGRDVKPDPTRSSSSMQLDNTVHPPRAAAVAAPSLGSLLESLEAWQLKIDLLLGSLDRHLATLHANSVNQSNDQQRHERHVRDMVTAIAHGGGGSSSSKSAGQASAGTKGGTSTKGTTKKGGGGGGGGGGELTMAEWNGSSSARDAGDVVVEDAAAGGEMEVDGPATGGSGTTRSALSPGGGVGHRHRKRGRV
ncbi:hypothetical protein JCM3766R1_001370 [Sporobolomyces carnicolor]